MTTTADQGLLAHVFCRAGNRQERLNALQIIARRDAAALLDKIDAAPAGGSDVAKLKRDLEVARDESAKLAREHQRLMHLADDYRRRAERAEAALHVAQRETDAARADRPQDDQPRPQRNGNGGGYRRRPRPIVELEEPAHCADCGAELHVGEPVRVYPGGRIYGTRCHGRRQ